MMTSADKESAKTKGSKMPSSAVLQAKTVAHATNSGADWTEAEIEFVQDSVQWPADEVALYLGRSLASLYTKRSQVAWTREKADSRITPGQVRAAAQSACGDCWLVHAGDCD
jgi:hypothetical protein